MVEATQSLGHPAQDLRSAPAVGRALKQGPIPIERRLVVARSEQKVRVQPAGAQVIVADELAHRDPEPLGDKGQRRHRRLGMSKLEGADVGGGVSALRQLGLRLPGAEPGLANP